MNRIVWLKAGKMIKSRLCQNMNVKGVIVLIQNLSSIHPVQEDYSGCDPPDAQDDCGERSTS